MIISATISESPPVLDGLMNAGMEPEGGHAHYTDTGGATDHVFALCHLLSYQFVLRIRDLRDRGLGTLERPSRYPTLEPILGRPIKTDAIRENWEDLIHLAASIRARVTLPSVMLKRLAAYKRQNRLDLALSEIGRLDRAFFTLDWLESHELHRRCHAGLNKSETRHVLAQAVFAHKQGRLVDRTLANQEHRASGLSLVIPPSPAGTRSTSIVPSIGCAAKASACPSICCRISPRLVGATSHSPATTSETVGPPILSAFDLSTNHSASSIPPPDHVHGPSNLACPGAQTVRCSLLGLRT